MKAKPIRPGLALILALAGGAFMFRHGDTAGPSAQPAKPAREWLHRAAPSDHPELGAVAWLRDFDEAAARAKAEGKLVLTLFDEVPGCATCQNFGKRVLSHPLLAEAAEDLFVPVAILNNAEGKDRLTLQAFREPAWNNPVVRIVSPDRRDVIPRLDGDYTLGGLATAMAEALKRSGRETPAYLALLAEEASLRSHKLQRATFGMHCFWTGEAALAARPGVVQTRPGFLGGKEVVEVEFDPSVVKYSDLLRGAQRMQCADAVFARDDEQQREAERAVGKKAVRTDEPIRPDGEPKYHLGRTSLRRVPMTELQAGRANAALAEGREPKAFLSPRQLGMLEIIERAAPARWPDFIGRDFIEAWPEALDLARQAEAPPRP